jgi:RNA polymerase sigma factor (sigma-70 family)
MLHDGGSDAHARHATLVAPALEQTVRAAATGDDEAWCALVTRFTNRVHRVARSHRLPADDVEDVAQTVWLRLLERVHTLRDPAAVGAWLETATRRESLRVLQTGAHEDVTDDVPSPDRASPESSPQERLVAAETRATLVASVRRLPGHQQRLAALLLAEPALSYLELAEALEMPIGSIGPTRARVLDRLRHDRDLVTAIGDARA